MPRAFSERARQLRDVMKADLQTKRTCFRVGGVGGEKIQGHRLSCGSLVGISSPSVRTGGCNHRGEMRGGRAGGGSDGAGKGHAGRSRRQRDVTPSGLGREEQRLRFKASALRGAQRLVSAEPR